MKLFYTTAIALAAIDPTAMAQTIWNGPVITFTKAPFADHTLASNQDLITSNAIITRANTEGIFNIALENAYVDEQSPAGTEWAFGTTVNLSGLVFQDWETTINGNPPASVNQPMVLHLITDDIYIDITFLSWGVGPGGGGPGGGGFSYQRSTELSVAVTEQVDLGQVVVTPNPSTDGIFQLRNGNSGMLDQLMLFDLTGIEVTEAAVISRIENVIQVDVSDLSSGVYLLMARVADRVIAKRLVLAGR